MPPSLPTHFKEIPPGKIDGEEDNYVQMHPSIGRSRAGSLRLTATNFGLVSQFSEDLQ